MHVVSLSLGIFDWSSSMLAISRPSPRLPRMFSAILSRLTLAVISFIFGARKKAIDWIVPNYFQFNSLTVKNNDIMKLTLAYRAVLASLVASCLPGHQLVSARSLLELTSRSLTTDTCSQLVDATGGSGNLLSLKLTRGDNEATTVQDSSKTYHEHGTFAATAEWYSDVCGDYSISCTHHECLMGLYFVPCKDADAETTDGGNAFSNNGFTSLQLQGTTELAFQGATTSLLECVRNCDNVNQAGGVGLDAEFMEIQNFAGDDTITVLAKTPKAPKAPTPKTPKAPKAPTPKGTARRLEEDEFEASWDDEEPDEDEEPTQSNLQAPVYSLKHGMGFFGVVGGTGCYSDVNGGQAQGNFGTVDGTMNIFVPYLRGFSSSTIADGLQDSAFKPVAQSSPLIVPGTKFASSLPSFPTLNKGEEDTDLKEVSVEAVPALTTIDWDVSTLSGIRDPNTHGWTVAQEGFDITFNIEDSYICPGGENSAEQKGTAKATINLSQAQDLMYTLSGQGEQLDTGFEMMKFKIDGAVVATATSTAAGKECSSGPLTVDYKVPPPYSLSAGPHELEVSFTTADGFDHVDSFYKLELSTAQ